MKLALKVIAITLLCGMLSGISPSPSYAQQDDFFAGLDDLFDQRKKAESVISRNAVEPHRSATELSSWLSGAVIEMMTMSPESAKQQLLKTRDLFINEKVFNRDFIEFLGEKGYYDFIVEQKFTMSAVSERLPTMICQKYLAKAYSWTFEVPLVILFKEPGAFEDRYFDDEKPAIATETVYLRVEIVHSPKIQKAEWNPHQVKIMTWKLMDEEDYYTTEDTECKI